MSSLDVRHSLFKRESDAAEWLVKNKCEVAGDSESSAGGRSGPCILLLLPPEIWCKLSLHCLSTSNNDNTLEESFIHCQ